MIHLSDEGLIGNSRGDYREAKFIGFAGKMYAGKTTAAEVVRASVSGSVIIPFAKKLKEIATSVFGWDGQKDDRGRRLLQTIGTECGREYNPNFWVDRWVDEVEKELFVSLFYKDGMYVIADDVRFDNEAEIIHKFGGKVILIGRENVGGSSDHASEKGISNYLVDRVLVNDGMMVEFKYDVKKMMRGIWQI